jgi:hypothetical protein
VSADSGIPPGCFYFAVGPERLHSALSVLSMGEVLTVCRRCVACLWGALGLWVVFSTLRNLDPHYPHYPSTFACLVFGATLAVGSCGFFFNKRWGRVSLGCLLVLVVLWCADMLLFIAFRGFEGGRVPLFYVVVSLVLASIFTWSILATTRPRFERT